MYQQKRSSNKKAKETNTIATNVTNTGFINCHSKKIEIAILYMQFC